jgi:hypothetical protein
MVRRFKGGDQVLVRMRSRRSKRQEVENEQAVSSACVV